MIYSEKRLKATLQIFRNAQSTDRRRAEGLQQANRRAFNKYGLRIQPKVPVAQLGSWQLDDSDSGDGEYDPARKRRTKSLFEKANGVKRKFSDVGDEQNGNKRLKTKECVHKELYLPRPSTSEELRSRYAFITLKIGSEKGKESLKSLARETETTNWPSKPEVRKKCPKDHETYEEMFNAQIEEIDNNGGRALRNGRKIPEIDVGAKKLAAPPGQSVEGKFQQPELAQTPRREEALTASHGLPSSSPTSPIPLEERPKEDVITIPLTPSPSPEPSESQTIDTSFAHPIDFQYHYRPGQAACHFCDDFMYGIMGLGRERSITVIQTGTSNKCYQECGNGFRSQGKEATRMCILCALKRIYIGNCDKHKLRALPGLDPRNPELSNEKMRAYVNQIMGHMNATIPVAKQTKGVHPTCSICCCPALYQCCTKQSKTITGSMAKYGKEVEGCGLLVCQLCEDVVSRRGGRLAYRFIRDHVEEKRAQDVQRPLRADVRFLFRGSLLHQAFDNPR